jgi:hypothetical protein
MALQSNFLGLDFVPVSVSVQRHRLQAMEEDKIFNPSKHIDDPFENGEVINYTLDDIQYTQPLQRYRRPS